MQQLVVYFTHLKRYSPFTLRPQCTLFIPQNFELPLSSISLGTAVIPCRNWTMVMQNVGG